MKCFPMFLIPTTTMLGCSILPVEGQAFILEEIIEATTGIDHIDVDDGEHTIIDIHTPEGDAHLAVSADGELYLNTVEGDVVVENGHAIPHDFPVAIPIYPGAIVTKSAASRMHQGPNSTHVLMLNTTDSPDQVEAFYKQNLALSLQGEFRKSDEVILIYQGTDSEPRVVMKITTTGAGSAIVLSVVVQPLEQW